jgi:hypothetical protein
MEINVEMKTENDKIFLFGGIFDQGEGQSI